MIITVTLNPSIDKTLYISQLEKDRKNVVTKAFENVGGKGINVSRTIQSLGGTSIALGFTGGENGRKIEDALEFSGIKTDFIQIDGNTRENIKIIEENRALTELNQQGSGVSESQLDALFQKIKQYANAESIFVLSGSAPPSVPTDIYAKITRIVHERKSKVIVDADGDLLKLSLDAKPDLIKPNIDEFRKIAGVSEHFTEQELFACIDKIQAKAIASVIVSSGEKGAFFALKYHKYHCKALKVEVKSTVGAGDAMVAVMALAYAQNLSDIEAITLAMATASAAIMTEGTLPASKEIVDVLISAVNLQQIRKRALL